MYPAGTLDEMPAVEVLVNVSPMSTSEVDIHKNATARRPLLFMANDVETLFVRWRHEVPGDLIKLDISRRVWV